MPNRWNWLTVDLVPIPITTHVVAVLAIDHGVVAGILASVTGDLLLSNASWKCVKTSAVTQPDWFAPNYNDSWWPAAVIISSNPDPGHGLVAAISRNASWIWTAAGCSDSRVLCRGRMDVPTR